MSAGVVIAGGGLAAQRCCETLRKQGYADPIRILCAEARPPYDRPPLSKGVLAGATPAAEVAFRAPDWYAANAVELTLGRAAASLDTAAEAVVLGDGTRVPYEWLLIATGSEPRRLELLADAENVHYLRTADDADRLRARLADGVRLVVVGAGFIGQEVAATARGLGASVTVLEALPAPLSGIFGEEIGAWFADAHRRQGVDVRCGATAAHAVAGAGGCITALVTSEGHEIPCDEIVVGIGVLPADGWLYGSGLGSGHVGVEVDESGCTAVAGIFAAGDVARPFDPRVGAHVRTEHWESAARLGASAARAMLALEAQSSPLASFWSDQYGVRIQYLGYASEADEMTVDGDPTASDCAVVWTRAGQPVAALLIGRPRQMPAFRRSIETTFQPMLERAQTP